MQLVIEIDEKDKADICNLHFISEDLQSKVGEAIIKGTPLPAGHGDLVDLGKIDEDRTDHDNPIIYLTTHDQYIEAVSLDYLNKLPVIIPADKKEENNELQNMDQ